LSGTTNQYSATGYYFASSAGRRPFLESRGSRRLDATNLLDLRLEKIFKIGADHRLSVYSDITNALNADTVTAVVTNIAGGSVLNPPPAAKGSTTLVPFNGPTSVLAPRQIQVGARWSF
jgi:hypothetical protein